MENFMNKMYELYLDMLQDARVDAGTGEKYAILVNAIINNLELNWDKTGLRIKDESKIVAIIQAMEPRMCEQALLELQEKDGLKLENKE